MGHRMTVADRILLIVDADGEVHGTEHLAREILGAHDVGHVRNVIARIEAESAINVTRQGPGRGHKNIIRRNRNSPGAPRRTVNEKLQTRSCNEAAEGNHRPDIFYVLRLWSAAPYTVAAYRAGNVRALLRRVLEQKG